MIALSGVSKAFGKHPVLDRLDLSVAPGEIVGLLGPNGVGKSTLLNIVGGLLRPDSGSVTVDGIERFADPDGARARVTYITQLPDFYRFLTVREHVSFVGAIRGLDEAALASAYAEVSNELSLEAFDGQLIGELSHGSQKRVALACAWVAPTPVGLYDESLAGLDPVVVGTITGGMRRRADSGQAALVATHDLDALARIADRALLLRGGRIEANWSRAEFGDGPGLARAYLAATRK